MDISKSNLSDQMQITSLRHQIYLQMSQNMEYFFTLCGLFKICLMSALAFLPSVILDHIFRR